MVRQGRGICLGSAGVLTLVWVGVMSHDFLETFFVYLLVFSVYTP